MNDYLLNARNLLHDWYDGLQFSQLQKRTFAGIAAVALILSAVVLTRGHSEPVVMTQAPQVKLIAPTLVVDVAGGVKKPGVYSLPANSRVTDAISAAGGAKKGADTSEVNLARMVRDGEQIYLEPPMTSTSSGQSVRTPIRANRVTGPMNINRASEKELEELPGIGPGRALKIFTCRSVNCPFVRIEDLHKVSGIGSATFAALKTKIRV